MLNVVPPAMPLRLIKRWLLIPMAVLLLIVVLIAATLQFYVFPNINSYQPRITQALSQSLKQKVHIERLGIHWQGLTPEATLYNLVLFDQQNRPALALTKVDAGLSWSSVLLLSPTLSKLHLDAPSLVIRRNRDGEIFLAGISLAGKGDPTFANWLIAQRRVQISHATVEWIDEQRNAPALKLQDLNLELDTPPWHRILSRHSLHVDTLASTTGKQRLMLDAQLTGNDLSKLPQWHGNAALKLPQTDLAAWHQWLDLPAQVHAGKGSMNASLEFARGSVQRLQTHLNVRNLSVTTKQHDQTFHAAFLNGDIEWKQLIHGGKLAISHLSTDIQPGLKLENANGQIQWQNDALQGTLSAQSLSLADSSALTEWLPANVDWADTLRGIAPQGTISNLRAQWQRKQQRWVDYAISADLSDIQSQAYANIPGLQDWRGHLEVHPKQGSLTLNTENASIDTAGLLRWPLPITKLQGKLAWENNGQKTLISTRDLKFENPHLGLNLEMEYQLGNPDGDQIQLQAQILHGNAKFAPFYYPNILGEATLHWLDTSILSGNVSGGEVIVRGPVNAFPFVNAAQQADPKLGLFRVTAHVEHVQLEYGTGWPTLDELNASLRFEGKRMDIEATAGETVGHQVVQAHADIPQLDADEPMLHVHAMAKGPVEQGIKFVNSSPVKEVTMGFTDTLKGSGDAELLLDLQIPMQDVDNSKFQGDYLIKNGHLNADANIGLPEIKRANGHLKFTEKSLNIQNMQAELFDNPATFNLNTRPDKSIVIQGNGRMTDAALKNLDNNLLTAALHGSTDWKASILIQKPKVQLEIRSQLIGMASDLPVPFHKTADTAANLLINIKQDTAQRDTVEIRYDDWISAMLLRQNTGGHTQISSGEVAINTPLQLPKGEGIHLHADFIKLNLDDWLEYLNQHSATASTDKHNTPPLNTIDVRAQVLQVFNRNLHQMHLNVIPGNDRLKMDIQSQELAGIADWIPGKRNKLQAKLDYLRIPRSLEVADSKPAGEIRRQTNAYPELDISAQSFQFGDKALGALQLQAYNSGDNWVIQHMGLNSPDSQLIADGVWRNTVRNPNTLFKFSLTSTNLGKTLQRFQPGELVKGGTGTMSGQIGWPGSPHEFAIERSNGNFKLQLENGQILKVQPGVGRLLGLLSLQSLPRRLTLDFRDLFSEGFAFDNIQCSANINDGILRSDDLFMTGPAAEAKIKGETNLKTETQRLKVKVAPHVSDTLSLAALAGGPVVGVAAFVAQKLLKDPLNKISSSEYMIGGTWDNPQELDVDKPNTPAPASSILK